MNSYDQVILYIKNISKGTLTLKYEHVDKIFDIFLTKEDTTVVQVQKLKFDSQSSTYQLMQTYYIPIAIAQEKIAKYKGMKQYHGFYKFSISQLNFNLFTVNPNLF